MLTCLLLQYSIESGNWLRSLRKQAAYFKRDDEFRNIMFKRLDELHEAHHVSPPTHDCDPGTAGSED